MNVESRAQAQETETRPAAGLTLRLLGPLAVSRAGEALALPPSRKVRALLAYLVMAPRPATRSALCEMLFDLPSDPKGELRWCLSKVRTVLDEPDRARVLTDGDGVALDLSACSVDALEVQAALRQGLASMPAERLESLAALFGHDEFLEGLDLPRSPAFSSWLVAERRRLRAAHAAVLEHWVQVLPANSDVALQALERWLALAPFDRRAHEGLLERLALRNRLREGDEHLAAAARQHEAEGQDWAHLTFAWRAAKARHAGVKISGPAPVIATAAVVPPEQPAAMARRASLAVMPFVDRTPGVALRGGLGDGMAHDIITRLSKLRSMFVIAEGTMFALSERHVDSQDVGRRLNVDYVASGSLRRGTNAQLHVSVQLTETRTAQVMWAEEFQVRVDDTFEVLDQVGNRIVTSIANQVEVAERNRAILKNPSSLNAWEAHHRGLWHMVRFTREDNHQARHFFQTAVRLDPTFARPHSGISFTHFQDAFLGWEGREASIALAYRAASEGLMADESDPAAHWSLGRAMWLQHKQDQALQELRTAIELSPNFALGHYTLGFVHAQSGDPAIAITESDHARDLSPMDPLLFGMLASKALALLRLGRLEDAADFGVRSASRPNAHVHIRAIAMCCLALRGRMREAKEYAQMIHQADARYSIEDLLLAFRMGPDAEALLRKAATLVAAD